MINSKLFLSTDENAKANCERISLEGKEIYCSQKVVAEDGMYLFSSGYIKNLSILAKREGIKAEGVSAILALYKKHSYNIAGLFEGIYSIIIVDSHELVFFRDGLGYDSLYYSYDKGKNGITISSSFKDIVSGIKPEINRDELIKYFLTADINKKSTLVNGIFVPKPFEVLSYNFVTHTMNTMIVPSFLQCQIMEFEEEKSIVDKTDSYLNQAIKNDLVQLGKPDDVVNSFSGGLDSSYIQLVLSNLGYPKAYTANMGYGGTARANSRFFADYYPIDQTVIDISNTEFIEGITEGIKICEMPFIFSGEPLIYFLYKKISEDHNSRDVICFDGLGADAILGYMRILFEVKYVSKYLNLLKLLFKMKPKNDQSTILLRYSKIINCVINNRISADDYAVLFGNKNFKLVYKAFNLNEDSLQRIFQDEVEIINSYPGNFIDKIYRYTAYEFDNRRIVNSRLSLAKFFNITLVLPYLDKEFNEFFIQVDPSMKVGLKNFSPVSKILFKKILRRYFPSHYINRKKIPGGIPLKEIFLSSRFIKENIEEIKESAYPFFKFNIDEIFDDKFNHALSLKLINFHLWYKDIFR